MSSRSKNGGFTLIELLVVVGIMAALAAMIVPNVARFVGTGEEEGAAWEVSTLQAAMDTAITDFGFTAVNASPAGGVTDFSSIGGADINPDAAATLYLYGDVQGAYLRVRFAKYGPYEWDTDGLVSRAP